MIHLVGRATAEPCVRAMGLYHVTAASTSRWKASRRYGTKSRRESRHLRVRMNRSTTAIEPCWPMAP